MIESSNNFQAVNFSITYKKIHIVYYSKIAVLVVPYRNILGRFTKKNQRDLYQPTYPLPKLSWIMGFLLTMFLYILCWKSPRDHTEKMATMFFLLGDVYFGGNNHGCKKLLFMHKSTNYFLRCMIFCITLVEYGPHSGLSTPDDVTPQIWFPCTAELGLDLVL